MEEVKSMSSGCGSFHNVEEEGVREELCSSGWLGVVVIVVIIVVGISIRSQSKILSVVVASGNVRLLFVVFISGIGIGIDAGGVVVVIVIVDGCYCSCLLICQRDWMLWMSWQLIALRSTAVHIFIGRLQCKVVLGAGGGVGIRGGGIIVVCT